MIDALIAGKVFGQPNTMTSKAGKPFATAKVKAAAGEGEALFVNVIAFDSDTVAALLALVASNRRVCWKRCLPEATPAIEF